MVFPFLAYPLVALFIYAVFRFLWRHCWSKYHDEFDSFAFSVVVGCACCFVSLLFIAIAQFAMGRFKDGLLSLGFALINIAVALWCLPSFVKT